jgi:hypothetical protein
MDEKAYERGCQQVWTQILRLALRNLPGLDKTVEAHVIERAEIVAMLRTVCERFGDNEWEDDLHLADVIDKHLLRHLEEKAC